MSPYIDPNPNRFLSLCNVTFKFWINVRCLSHRFPPYSHCYSVKHGAPSSTTLPSRPGSHPETHHGTGWQLHSRGFLSLLLLVCDVVQLLSGAVNVLLSLPHRNESVVGRNSLGADAVLLVSELVLHRPSVRELVRTCVDHVEFVRQEVGS